ncbi:MAG: hypothetical protein ACF8TS_20740 [Maioricimonas sp. JB049]
MSTIHPDYVLRNGMSRREYISAMTPGAQVAGNLAVLLWLLLAIFLKSL